MLKLLNWAFHGFHIALTLFTAFGWIWPQLRVLHLFICALTLVSWLGIGLMIGKPGFCLITEVHFYIRRRLELQTERQSYLVYLAEFLTRRPANPQAVELGAQAVFYAVTLISLTLVILARS